MPQSWLQALADTFIKKLNKASDKYIKDAQKRFDICKQCEHYLPQSFHRCDVCGCFLKVKCNDSVFHCTLDKW